MRNEQRNSEHGSVVSRVCGERAPSSDLIEGKLPEWQHFESLLHDLSTVGRTHVLATTKSKNGHELPLVAMSFGSQDPTAPTLCLVGGVHGLERIGSQVVLALMQSFSELVLWDEMIQHALSKIRICFFPLVNPIGILERTR